MLGVMIDTLRKQVDEPIAASTLAIDDKRRATNALRVEVQKPNGTTEKLMHIVDLLLGAKDGPSDSG